MLKISFVFMLPRNFDKSRILYFLFEVDKNIKSNLLTNSSNTQAFSITFGKPSFASETK